MSYEMTLKIRRSGHSFPYGLVTHQSVHQHLVGGLGQMALLARLAEQLDEVAVAYNIIGDDHIAAHQSVVNKVGNLVGQFALAVVQAEVVRVVRYGLQAGGAAALGALGATSKQKPEVMLLLSGVAFVGGYLLGELRPMRQPMLRADWDHFRGWLWTSVPAAPSGGASVADGGQ